MPYPFAMIVLASMNGTLLFRRSASFVLLGSSLVLGACGVDMHGLFQGDGGEDAPSRDAGQDVGSTADRAADAFMDIAVDRRVPDAPAESGPGNDATLDPRLDADVARDASVDPDTRMDSGPDADSAADRATEPDASRDVSVDGDGARDLGTDPTQDPTAEDAAAEPSLDVASDPTMDPVLDVVDASRDVFDAEPPFSCSGSCNTFPNISQTVTRSVDSDPTPTMTGGNIVDGTYVVTEVVHYNDDNSMFSLSETSVIQGNFDAWIASTSGGPEVRYTTTFTTNNNQLVFNFCCPGTGPLTILYSSDGTHIRYIDPGNPNRVITFTRQ